MQIHTYISMYIYTYLLNHVLSAGSCPPTTGYPIRRQADRLCNQFGLRSRSNEKPGAHLPHDHPSIEAIRTHIKSLTDAHAVHERLICNFDQVWCLQFRPKRSCIQKDSQLAGSTDDALKKSHCLRKIRHNLELVLNLPVSEPNPSERQIVQAPSKPRIAGGKAATAMVSEWRVPRTVTTLSFIDGHMGRSFVTLREGNLPEETRTRLGKELGKYLVIDQPQPKSHMWSEVTFVRYLCHLSQELVGTCS